jgi:outer membrane protein OmpA-like peptidoglycan-associated protein
MRCVLSFIPALLVLSACSSPPKPPTVDESTRRPANSAMAVELQVCKIDLQNTRIVATESSRLVESTAEALERVSARQPIVTTVAVAPPSNSVFTIRFDFASTQVLLPADIATTLIEDARSAPLVLLRGRTDGSTDAPSESRIARERADAVRAYLVGAGVDPSRIRTTYQPAGDHAADNTNPSGRSLNRRVEIEVYRAAPVVMASSAAHLR